MRRFLNANIRSKGYDERLPTMVLSVITSAGEELASRQFGGSDLDGKTETRTRLAVPTIHEEDLFAKLLMPNGSSLVRPIPRDTLEPSVQFDVGFDSPAESMSWSAVRLKYDSGAPNLANQPGIAEAWIQRWALVDQEWVRVKFDTARAEGRQSAFQVEVKESQYPGALVVNTGARVPHVLALPARTKMRALVTTTRQNLATRSTQVLLGGYGSKAEGLLDFLRRGSLDAAGRIADEARHALEGKRQDRLGATAAAYFLLRTRDWKRMPAQWLHNLASWNEDLPDPQLIQACSKILRGVSAGQAARIAHGALQGALVSGLPIFWEAREVIAELYSWCGGVSKLRPSQDAFIRSMLVAAKPAGLSFGFSGISPARPSIRVGEEPDTRFSPVWNLEYEAVMSADLPGVLFSGVERPVDTIFLRDYF